MTEARVTLTPLERLRLRDALEERWRHQVHLITELAVALHAALDDQPDIDPDATAVALSDARLHLVEIEQAMRRIDDRSYGRCLACLIPLPFVELLDNPSAHRCGDCRRAGATRQAPAIANAG